MLCYASYFLFVFLSVPILSILFFSATDITEKEEVNNLLLLYHVKTNETEKIEFEEYIKGVVYAEMPSSFNIEALKAQSVAARTYTYRKIKEGCHKNGNICDDSGHCQAWRGYDLSSGWQRVSDAVEKTRGQIITYNNEPANALFHASSGGATEDAVNVWGGGEVPYLISVKSPGENEIMKNFETTVEVSKKEFFNKLGRLKDKILHINSEIKIKEMSDSDRVIKMRVGDEVFSGNEIREAFNLRSSKFNLLLEKDKIYFIVQGYGHGVGMSQWGAEVMAREGKTYKSILKHYYPGTEVHSIF